MKNIVFLLLIAACLSAEPIVLYPKDPLPPRILERRAAFDIGSGQIKVQVSDVDIRTNQIVQVLLADNTRVPLREDLAKSLDGRLSLEVQNHTVEVIAQLMQKVALFQPKRCHAIATESMRLAKNGNELAERIKQETGLPVTIVSQEEEGILGFISAVHETNASLNHAVSWDFGGGSFQITTKCGDQYCVYQGRLGKVPLKNVLLAMQGKDPLASPNPISREEALEALQFIHEQVQNVPETIMQKLRNPDTVVLGVGIHPLWGMEHNTHYDVSRIMQELHGRLNLTDEQIRIKDAIPPDKQSSAAYVVNNLIFAAGVMEALGIRQVHYVGTPGANAVGALLSPQYWN